MREKSEQKNYKSTGDKNHKRNTARENKEEFERKNKAIFLVPNPRKIYEFFQNRRNICVWEVCVVGFYQRTH